MRDHARVEPLSKRRLFQTTELDEARAIVADKFCDHGLHIETNAAQFDACHHRAEGHAASLNYIRYGADVRIAPGELGSFYLIQIPLAGMAEIDNRGGRIQTCVGKGSVLNPHRDTQMRWREGCRQLLLQIDATALTQEAERLLGATISQPITFETLIDEDRIATADWVRKLKTCFDLAEKNAIFGSDSSGTQLLVERELITDFLRSQASNISPLIASAPSTAVNKHLRRALQYIHANLQGSITVSDIADASGTTPRNLQLYFSSEFGLSPMRYLKQQRLILAHRLIQQSQGNVALGDISLQAGFTHFGRFSADFRARYGEAPSETKRRAMSRASRLPNTL
ncbi:MAG: AraC family transcriptional regulator [Pseudomonadota bacterium]